MRASLPRAALAALLAAAVCAPASRALGIAETRGDFYYDADGNLLGHRNAELPRGMERIPMSHAEQFRLMGIELPAAPMRLAPREVFPKPARVDDRPALQRDKVIVKFVDDVTVRLRGGKLRRGSAAMSDVEAILAQYPDAALHRAFDVEERILDENRESGERISGRALADLNNFYVFTFDVPSERGAALANELLALDVVEAAYLQAPGAEPGPCGDVAPATPSWEANQTYLDAAPTGLDARYAWSYHAGGNGNGPGFWVADLEWDWCTGHEDIPATAADVLNGLSGAAGPDHGTAVLGEIGACANGIGMTGISPDVTLKMCDFDSELTWAANVQEADAWLVPGEVMLLEIHILGPASGLACTCNCAQFEFVPVEWDLATFLAIQTATANGIIVVEAGGNGSMNLDSAIYGGWFNPSHDSGAIVVGAGVPGTHAPECWTDFGSRINVHAWGSAIYSTGYGNLWNGVAGCTQGYTFTFGGTSGASPMIVGAAADLQGIAKSKYAVTLSPGQMRTLLATGGTPQGAPTTRNIGPMPNLVNAINALEPDVISSFTPGGWSYPVVPRDVADANGGYAPLGAGPLPGNATGTYWNFTEMNAPWAYTPTLHEPRVQTYVDATPWWFAYNSNLPPGGWQYVANVGPDWIKGGRHTVLSRADNWGVEEESDEANDWSRQFIWSPLALATNVPVRRSYDPPRTSTGWGPYYNAEGFSGATPSYWTAFAVLPADAATDFDVYLHNETPANVPQQGFGATLTSSASGGDYSDFVIVDRNRVAGGTYYASAIDWTGTGDKAVECDTDTGVLPNPGTAGPYALQSGEILNLHEIYLSAGVPTRIQIQWLGGDADFGMSVYQDPSGFNSKWFGVTGGLADNEGAHRDEWVVLTRSGFHGVAVWKRASADLDRTLTYNVIVSQLPNLAERTPSGWYGPIVPRNEFDATVSYAPLSATLTGNAQTTVLNWSTKNEGPGSANGFQDNIYFDDVWNWYSFAGLLPEANWAQWVNAFNGPNNAIRGGRHHLRLESDATASVPESIEYDNNYTDWFAWTGLPLAPDATVTRGAPPVKDPLGFGPDYACDGLSSSLSSYWTAVGVLPATMGADYDVRMHLPYVGSRDGFNSWLRWSGDATDGAVDFGVVNYNVAPVVPDFSVLNWNAAGDAFVAERAEAHGVLGILPGVNTHGPYTLGADHVLQMYEFYVSAAVVGQPMYISLAYDSGNANLGIRVLDGSQPYHDKFSGWSSDTGGPGADEHVTPIVFASPGFHGIVVHKTDATDLAKTATYRLILSTGAPATDAPSVEALPTAFALASPRPNPSDAETSIRFDVPAGGGTARVAVYDVNGRKVTTLADGVQPAGRHTLVWDGRDGQGARVAAGVYFVRLETAALRETRKITRLR